VFAVVESDSQELVLVYEAEKDSSWLLQRSSIDFPMSPPSAGSKGDLVQ
jgi:hypothetical protein